MATQSLFAELPDLYRSFFPDLFDQPVPKETFATCNNCAMVCRNNQDKDTLAMKSFRADRKCCTYYPSIPNYLIGGLLSDPNPLLAEGQRRIREAIKEKKGITPYGVIAPRKYTLLYRFGSGKGFGQSGNLLCPYYNRENSNCSIWKYREAVCSTFFCKSVSAQKGKVFWHTVNGYLGHIQESLVQHILFDEGFDSIMILDNFMPNSDPSSPVPITAEDLDDLPPTDKEYSAMWKDWEGKEIEFYIKAYNVVSSMSSEEFNAITGIREQLLLANINKSRDAILNYPEILILNPKEDGDLESDMFKVHFKEIDASFSLPSVVFRYFDGKHTVKEIQALLDQEEDIELSDELVASLFHYKILIEEKKSKEVAKAVPVAAT